ncbi:VPS9 protein [Coleophoma cylindrospora]|uniref:VPS9 protein n=1 Tax=Coleophoma cylindrospora TaxID=1849047 RepID=A0A3D8ST41_9HELO|nr:VPS9 protein [Coleophoma cylindrospora]
MIFSLPEFMASPNSRKEDRPRQLHVSKSFTRSEPNSPAFTRNQRANTIQNGAVSGVNNADKSASKRAASGPQGDAFEKSVEEEERQGDLSGKLPADFDELPIELVALADSFIDSLSAKVHASPPTVDKLSALFQDFYTVAAQHINTHISTLSSRQHRERSPAPSASSLSSTASKLRAKAASISKQERPKIVQLERRDSEQQMLTAEEIADRKRARRVLEQKRVALEEAVERRVTEGIYDRIWRHRSTQDEAQDEKLRSKTAALSVVGIGLTDLGVDLGQSSNENPDAAAEKEQEVKEWLESARDDLLAMDEERYPLGKLQHLKAAHKSIVDTLSHFHPSSSADEIMPMLIYTLITSRPEGMNVISNLYFIQRFRCESKIDGEAAYCLTNLEAAITFLETVDLASLREDEIPSGPPKAGSRPTTPKSGRPSPLALEGARGVSAPAISPAAMSPTHSKAQMAPLGLRPATQNRRLSDLFQPPAQALGAAGEKILTTADQGFSNIGNSLGESYKFLLGKLKDRDGENSDIVVPKTLDDARKLVSTPPPEEDNPASGESSLNDSEVVSERDRRDSAHEKPDDKVLSMITGRRLRDRSVDSSRSGGSASGSGKKVAFASEEVQGASPLGPATPISSNPPIVESMRNLGNSLNPMSRIAGMGGVMRGFGRAATSPMPPANKAIPDGGVADLTTTFPDLAPVLPPKETVKVAPPIKRFMEVQNPGELRINEVLELLRDYRRLAGALKDMGAV